MTSHLVLLAALVLALGTPSNVATFDYQKPLKPKPRATCWPGEAEVENRHVGKHRPITLPPELAKAKVRRSVILLKLCVSDSGDVARVIVLKSSGNADVDNYYSKELAKRTFTPVERQNRKVRSFVPVAVTLYIK